MDSQLAAFANLLLGRNLRGEGLLRLAVILSCLPWAAFAENGSTAKTAARVTAEVFPSSKVSASPFRFSISPGKDPERISYWDNAGAATLVVSGVPNHTYTLLLPEHVTLIPKNGTSASENIEVYGFNSSVGRWIGSASSGGTSVQRLGATRSPISADAPAGEYRGVVPITVIYP